MTSFWKREHRLEPRLFLMASISILTKIILQIHCQPCGYSLILTQVLPLPQMMLMDLIPAVNPMSLTAGALSALILSAHIESQR